MTVQDYTKQGIDIATLPLRVLMNLDIKTIEEQEQVQKLVNSRRRFTPVAQPINLRSDKTDFKTGEQEQEFQKVIDARVAAQRVWTADEMTEENNPEHSPVVENVVENPVETTETIVDDSPVDTTASTEELSAQESTLKAKIKNLKMQVGKLEKKIKLA